MNEIITMKRDELRTRLDEFFEKKPAHVFIIDLVPTGESTVFSMYPESEYSVFHTFATFLDDIKTQKPNSGAVITHDKGEEIQNFIFRVRNFECDRAKRLIVTCRDGSHVSGAVAQYAMQWVMDDDEKEFNKLNTDIIPNEFILNDLYLHPLI